MKLSLLSAVLFLFTEISFAQEELNYTVTSDSQIQNIKGNFEAIGNVFVKYLESEGLSIQESYGDELTIFTDSGLFKFNSENKNRVKTKLKF